MKVISKQSGAWQETGTKFEVCVNIKSTDDSDYDVPTFYGYKCESYENVINSLKFFAKYGDSYFALMCLLVVITTEVSMRNETLIWVKLKDVKRCMSKLWWSLSDQSKTFWM